MWLYPAAPPHFHICISCSAVETGFALLRFVVNLILPYLTIAFLVEYYCLITDISIMQSSTMVTPAGDPFLDGRPTSTSSARLLRKKIYKDAETKMLLTDFPSAMAPGVITPPSIPTPPPTLESKTKDRPASEHSSYFFWRRKSKRLSSAARKEMMENAVKDNPIAVDPAYMESISEAGSGEIGVDPEYSIDPKAIGKEEVEAIKKNGKEVAMPPPIPTISIAVDTTYLEGPSYPPPPPPRSKDRRGSAASSGSNKLRKERKGSHSSTTSAKEPLEDRKGSEASWFTSPKYGKGRQNSDASVHSINPLTNTPAPSSSKSKRKAKNRTEPPKRRRPSSDESFLDARPRPVMNRAKKRQGIVFGDGTIAPLKPMHGEQYIDAGDGNIERREWGSIGDIRIIETFSIVEEAPLSPPPLNLRARKSSSALPHLNDVKTPRTVKKLGSSWNIDAGENSDVHVKGEGYLDYLAETDPAAYNAVVEQEGGVEYILLDQARSFVDEMTAYIK